MVVQTARGRLAWPALYGTGAGLPGRCRRSSARPYGRPSANGRLCWARRWPDFCVISLSERRCPTWEVIQKLTGTAPRWEISALHSIIPLLPRAGRTHLQRQCASCAQTARRMIPSAALCATLAARAIAQVLLLAELENTPVDMFTTVYIGLQQYPRPFGPDGHPQGYRK